MGFRKDEPELMNKFNGILNEMKKDGTAAQIATKWFGKDIIK